MLVLSRKKNESVFVNGNIRIVIVDVRGDKVQLGIEAPPEVAVYRSEVLEKIKRAAKADEVVTLDMSSQGAVLRPQKKNERPKKENPRLKKGNSSHKSEGQPRSS
jgi:carbon storage regulator